MAVNEKSKEWDKENMTTLSCRIRKDEAAKFRLECERLGTTPHSVLKRSIEAFVKESSCVAVPCETTNMKLERENKELRDMLKCAISRAEHAEKLVDKWLRSADRK